MSIDLRSLSSILIQQHNVLWFNNEGNPNEYSDEGMEYKIKGYGVTIKVQMTGRNNLELKSPYFENVSNQAWVTIEPENERVFKIISNHFQSHTWNGEPLFKPLAARVFNKVIINGIRTL